MTLGSEIRRVRGMRRREEFAGVIGCSLQTVIRWETSKTVPSDHQHIERLVREGVTLDAIKAAQGRVVAA